MIDIINAIHEDELEMIKELFVDYYDWLGGEKQLPDFEVELTGLPGDYEEPSGRLLLALEDDWPVGCIALREVEQGTGEIKRLYVRDDYKGKGIGKTLIVRIIEEAKRVGYKNIRLDTAIFMKQAVHLFHAYGFRDVNSADSDINADDLYMELKL